MSKYKDFLLKYIHHVGTEEGVDFILDKHHTWQSVFTEAEWEEMQALAKESFDRRREWRRSDPPFTPRPPQRESYD